LNISAKLQGVFAKCDVD